MGGATPAERNASDAGAYYAPPLYAVRTLCAVREKPPNSAGRVVFGVEVLAVLNRPEGSLSHYMLQDGGFGSEVSDTARGSWECGVWGSKVCVEECGWTPLRVAGVRGPRKRAAVMEAVWGGIYGG